MLQSWTDTNTDKSLVRAINELTAGNPDYWSFRKDARRDGVHGLIQYPAMMIPSMQSKLLELVNEAHGNVQRVLDPFVGGGTMLTETMTQGMSFSGFDINPLAILACKVKAGPYVTNGLREIIEGILEEIRHDCKRDFSVNFNGQAKWFSKGASIGLSRIRRAIITKSDLWVRQFAWLCMAETIRRCSNSRTSTYKLHIKPDDGSAITADRVIRIFSEVIQSNALRVLRQQEVFSEFGVIECGRYRGSINIQYQDVTKVNPKSQNIKSTVLFTSPPYGDNATTIPYGQFSFLALNWIPLCDIDLDIPLDINKNTHSIDSASVGGSNRNAAVKASELSEVSAEFNKFHKRVGGSEFSYGKRLSSFCFDLRDSIKSFSNLIENNGYMVWTLGNRSLDGKRVPLDKIVWEFLEEQGMRRVLQFERTIPSKRMPTRNSCSDTMATEIVLIAGS
ncbi:MAG: site-specific DNA-methyltransferase [Candidatus Thiodiazotropha sp. (ex Troendleina suluensis)]|nr:site-specific DNA-methyltransferase [Candidatus Thiodiazotropha sp. (ex Troendleina suluensis)]